MNKHTFQRPTNMAAALVNAVVQQDPKQKNWISRAVADRALHTKVGNVVERDNWNLTPRSEKQT
jgi:hypothetical protein